MLDYLLAWAGTSAFYSIVKDLVKESAQDWTKDFLKGIPGKAGEIILEKISPSEQQKAFKSASASFLKLVEKELETHGLSKEEIER